MNLSNSDAGVSIKRRPAHEGTVIAIAIWGRALLMYAILTLPCLLIPFVYLYSVVIAFICSLPGLFVLLPVMWLLPHMLLRKARRLGWVIAFLLSLAAGSLSMQMGLSQGEDLVNEEMSEEFHLLAYSLTVICVTVSFLSSLRRVKAYFHPRTPQQLA